MKHRSKGCAALLVIFFVLAVMPLGLLIQMRNGTKRIERKRICHTLPQAKRENAVPAILHVRATTEQDARTVGTWMFHNPLWHLMVWTDDAKKHFIAGLDSKSKEALEKSGAHAENDLFKLIVLEELGGIFIEGKSGISVNGSLEEGLEKKGFYALEPDLEGGTNLIAASAHDPATKKLRIEIEKDERHQSLEKSLALQGLVKRLPEQVRAKIIRSG